VLRNRGLMGSCHTGVRAGTSQMVACTVASCMVAYIECNDLWGIAEPMHAVAVAVIVLDVAAWDNIKVFALGDCKCCEQGSAGSYSLGICLLA